MSLHDAPTSVPGGHRRVFALVAVLIAQAMIILDTSVVNVALPTIQRDLDLGRADLTWVINSYLLSFGSLLLPAGRLGDLVGRRKMFLVGVAVFTAASAACALATTSTQLIVARFVQGGGGAFASAAVLALIITEFPEAADRARAMGAYLLVTIGGGSLGLVLGGVLTETLSWRWIFTINIPFGVLVVAVVPFFMAETRAAERVGGVDVPGTLLVVAAGLIGIDAIVQAADVGWLSARTLGFGAVAVLLLVAFVAWEARTAYPLMPLRILRLRSLMGSSAIRAVLVVSMYGNFFFGALFLAQVLGYDPIGTGLAYLPQTASVAALSLGATARLMRRFGPRAVLLSGLLITLAGLLLMLGLNDETNYFPLIFFAFVLLGVGGGMVFMPLLTMAVSDVAPADAGLASGIVNVSSQISAAVGLAVLGSVASSRTDSLLAHGHSATDALIGGNRLGILIAAGCVVVGFLLALIVLRAPAAAPEPDPANAARPEPDTAPDLNPA